jgi:hypothetical protein
MPGCPTEDGMVTVLKKLSMAKMSKIVGHSIAGEALSHEIRET